MPAVILKLLIAANEMTMSTARYLVTTILVILFCFDAVSQSNDFETVRQRVIDELLRDPVDDQDISGILGLMKEDGSFSDINYEDLSRTAGFPQRRHTYRLVDLAKAYQSENSDYYRSSELKDQITLSLDYWVEHDFFGDNWHNNQISTPTNLVNLMLVIGDELPEELVEGAQPIIGRAHMNASGARPSGDRIVIAGILGKNLLFIRDEEQFGEIIELIEGEVKFSTGHRGMQHDYSFHHRHDRVNNTTSYGYGKYANAFGEWSYYVANTQYAFSVEKINQLVDYYLDGIYKQLVYGVYTDISVKNRSITHKATFEPRGTLEVERLIFSTDYRQDELEEIIKLRKGQIAPSQSFAKFFWQTEHFVVQRPDYYTTVRMFSTRNRNMEKPYNGPGKLTHHRADGTNYVMLTGAEYHNIWPVYDWQKISGTTILQKPHLPPPDQIQQDGLTDFVGAVTDGLYGAVAFDFRSPHDLIAAKKSWFFFDDEYVCLGTGIKGDRDLPIVTTVNQSLMRSEVLISQEGVISTLPQGNHEMSGIDWVYQDRIGYILTDQSSVHIDNEKQYGRWSDITDQKNISDSLVSRDVFMMYFDHGEDPDSASYQYIVVPNVSADELDQSQADQRGLHILSNSTRVQAVESEEQGILQAAFYGSGRIKSVTGLDLTMESQGMVMLKLHEGRVTGLTLSDPSRLLSSITLSLSGKYESDSDHVVVEHLSDQTRITTDLPQGVYAGKSISFSLQ